MFRNEKYEFLQVRTWHECGFVFVGVQGENEGQVVAVGQDEGSEGVQGGEGLENRTFFDPSSGVMKILRDC